MTANTREQELLQELFRNGLLIPSGVPGIYGRGAGFERLVQQLGQALDVLTSDDEAEPVHFPPVLPRAVLERTGYLETFPHLCGSVFSFMGDESQHRSLLARMDAGEPLDAHQQMTEVALTPAGCYPLYPSCAGALPRGGRTFDLTSYCFRHEPSADPTRMQMFRMRELVRLGEPAEVQDWRAQWMERSLAFLRDLGLDTELASASDPFFGRAGRMLATNQRDQGLKHEVVCPVCSPDKPTALISLNYHQDHFGSLFDIRTSSGSIAHTACIGFGLERLVIALLQTHGMKPHRWPRTLHSLMKS